MKIREGWREEGIEGRRKEWRKEEQKKEGRKEWRDNEL